MTALLITWLVIQVLALVTAMILTAPAAVALALAPPVLGVRYLRRRTGGQPHGGP